MKKSLLMVAILLIGISSVMAVSNGQVDDGEPAVHPNVGIGCGLTDGEVSGLSVYSGVLIAPDAYLTTARNAYTTQQRMNLGYREYVTFHWFPWDAQVPAQVVEVTGTLIEDGYEYIEEMGGLEAFQSPRPSKAGLGVLYLATPQYDLPIAALPEPGLLDELSAQNGLKDAPITAAGFGIEMHFDPGQGPYFTNWLGARTYATLEYQALGPKFLILSMNEELGNGGVCFGDEGGPNYLDVDGAPVLVALTAFYDSSCRTLSRALRLDTETSQAFLLSALSE